jgi:dihydrodipicolinate synthase/N-acetylneuraminate lyase
LIFAGAYLTREEHSRVARLAVEAADGTMTLNHAGDPASIDAAARVVAAAAARLGLTQTVNLPRPLRPLDASARHQLDQGLDRLGLLTRTEEGPPCTQ